MPQVSIIGGGISGLICAIELERHGITPVIIEKDDQLGGRLKTVEINNCFFDHGFQVLLTAYPAAQRYLDFKKLNLKKFIPGAAIFKEGTIYKIGDPLRNLSFLLPILNFPSVNMRDGILIMKLVLKLKWRSISKIFSSPEKSTKDYLNDFGFSEAIIQDFFRPFLGGIFLDRSLQTSSRMFEFVMKMFSNGSAAIPGKGIQEIPRQLQSKLLRTDILLNAEVVHLDENQITLGNGNKLKTDYTIIATDPSRLLPSFKPDPVRWNECINLYFKVNHSIFGKPVLGLMANPDSIINNFHFVTDVQPCDGTQIISVTVLEARKKSEKEIIEAVTREIVLLGDNIRPEFIKSFKITQALPVLKTLKFKPSFQDMKISERIFQTGDHLSNPSLNGAMEAGKSTADLLLKTIQVN